MNQTLQQIQALLLAQHDALSSRLDSETDPAEAKAILLEMQEVLHRVDLVQNLLFRQSSQQLDNLMVGVRSANDALTQSLATAADFTGVLSSVSNFLAAVDQAIDLAKTLPV
jgi:hypothetical protein